MSNSNLINVKVHTKSATWSTAINGTIEAAEKYFLGNWFNIGVYPVEQIECVLKVEEC